MVDSNSNPATDNTPSSTANRRDFIKLTGGGLVSAGLLVAAGCGSDNGSGGKPVTLSLATWGAPDHPQVTAFVPAFTKLVKERSKGRLEIKHFPSDQLVKEDDVPTAIPNGTVDIALTAVPQWTSVEADLGISSTPLFSFTLEQFEHVMKPDSALFKKFDALLEKHNTTLLAPINIGPLVLTSKQRMKSPEDFNGKTIRTPSDPEAQLMRTLGASPTTMSVNDVYSALQRGTIDAAYQGLGGAAGLNVFEVSKYLLLPGGVFGTFLNAYVMNREKLNSLPSDLRKALLSSATSAGESTKKNMPRLYERDAQKMEKQGMTVTKLSADNEQFGEVIEPLVEKYRGQFSADVVDAVKQARKGAS